MKGSSPSSAAAAAQAPTRATARSASTPTPDPRARFVLSGVSARIDPRTDAARKDIADLALAGTLFAPHYARPLERVCGTASAMMRVAPSSSAEAASQLLLGEGFCVVDMSGGWAWGFSAHDHYVGYIEAASLVTPAATPSAAPSLGIDPVALAEGLIDLPYLWGGRGGGGVDCSGLVQRVYGKAGIAMPRDSDQQERVGAVIDEREPLRRGDLVHFPGHVAIMVDPFDVIHASSHWMAVKVEPLADLVARSAPLISRRRMLP